MFPRTVATKSRRLFAFFAVILLGSIDAEVSAQVPGRIAYQGFLTNSAGSPVNGATQMTFKLYTASSGGVPVWTEAQSVTVANGTYTVLLGAVTSLSAVPFNVPYYLGVTVASDAEMTPRQLLASAPYALRAAIADAVAGQPVVNTVTRSVTNTTGVGSSSCLSGEILVGGGCDCTGARSSGTNYGVVFACSPAGQSMVGACYDYQFSSLYGASPVAVRAICLAGITFKTSAPDSSEAEVEAALGRLAERRKEFYQATAQ